MADALVSTILEQMMTIARHQVLIKRRLVMLACMHAKAFLYSRTIVFRTIRVIFCQRFLIIFQQFANSFLLIVLSAFLFFEAR
jgi:hypothetical protein